LSALLGTLHSLGQKSTPGTVRKLLTIYFSGVSVEHFSAQ